MSKGYKMLVLVTVLISVLVLAVFYKSSSFYLFPFPNNNEIKLGTYHEPLESNFSTGKVELENLKLKIDYKLGTGSLDPFIGFFIHKQNTTDSFFDFEEFNEISLFIEATNATRIPLTYTVNYKGYTTTQEELTNIPFTTVIDYNGPGWYTISLNEFKKQSWWFREQKKKEDEFPNISLNRVNYFVIGSCQVLGQGGEDQITISSIELSYNNFSFVIITVGMTLVVLILIVLMGIQKKEKVLVPVFSQDVEVEANSNLEIITHYIGQNYSNPNLSKEDLQKALGFSSRQIGIELKEGLNSSFKNYLNKIRLAEVKRLLKESTLPISEIAYKCGYNNISHFNRVFKTETDQSPKQFRGEEQ